MRWTKLPVAVMITGIVFAAFCAVSDYSGSTQTTSVASTTDSQPGGG